MNKIIFKKLLAETWQSLFALPLAWYVLDDTNYENNFFMHLSVAYISVVIHFILFKYAEVSKGE